MKKLPIGLQDFRGIREDGYLYVDKTEQIYHIINSGKYYFLARPRRFGKSLLLSTIKEIYRGAKTLFNDLWIADRWNWEQQFAVLHFSFNSIGYRELGLEKALYKMLEEAADTQQIQLENEGISQRFRELIYKIAQHNKVVILID